MTNPDKVTSQLARNPALIAGLLGSVPPQDLKRRPRPGKWSAHEHACHLAVMEPMWGSDRTDPAARITPLSSPTSPTKMTRPLAELDPACVGRLRSGRQRGGLPAAGH
jgi:hypothetical protein